MNDATPFANFIPSEPAPPVGEPAKTKKPRKNAAKKAKGIPVTNEPETKPEPSPKPTRQKRAKKVKAPRAMKVDLNFAMVAMAGLKEEDADFVSKVVTAMQPFSKKQRTRIVHALAKLFA